MSMLTDTRKRVLARITKIPEDQVQKWHDIAKFAIYNSPTKKTDEPNRYILVMQQLYRSFLRRNPHDAG